MDADELRKSQRRYKQSGSSSSNPKSVAGRQISKHDVMTTPSQESDLDDDYDELMEEPTTPSADNSERNIMSMLSVRLVPIECLRCVRLLANLESRGMSKISYHPSYFQFRKRGHSGPPRALHEVQL
jgi:hypothetical protein